MVRALLVGLVALLALLPTNERQMAYDWSGVNWRLIYEDDFSGYNSQEEFEEAYPPLFGSSADYPVWGATVGPDGQAGIVGTGSYGVGKKGLNPSGRFLRITVRVDKKGVPTNPNVKFINVYYFYDANAAYNAIEIAGYYNRPSPLFTNDTTGVIGHPDIDNSKPNDYFPEGAGGTDLELRVAFSTLTGGVANADGALELFVDGALVFTFEGVVQQSVSEAFADPYWNGFSVGGWGALSDLKVYDSVALTTPNIPIDRSAKCCGSDAVPGSGAPSPGAGVERPRLAVPGWTEPCTGGGTVDAVADLDDGERWG